ncbi:MAG: AzlC family ABC transporter permease [Alphaproteobacteria bacterium]|nr:AzlC family ABC transporter permease [Alphaproteobacteria bacterium]
MSGRRVWHHPAFWQGMRDISGLSIGIAAWGLMTGVAMANAHIGTAAALFMATWVFAGSSMLAAIPLLAQEAPMWVVLATGFCVNLRFVVFSAHLRPYLAHWPRLHRLTLAYLTADLSYVQFVRRFQHPPQNSDEQIEQRAYLLGNTGLNWASWTVAGWVGVLLAQWVPTHWGLGFAGMCALTGLTISLAQDRYKALSAGLAASAAVASAALPLKLNILLGIAVAVALCLLVAPRPTVKAAP